LCRELGLESRLHGTNDKIRRTYVMRAGALHELPEGLTGLIPSRFAPFVRSRLISPAGKLRMAMEVLIPRRLDGTKDDESLAAFVERRLGREVYDRLIEPLMSGIYAGDGEQLSLAATFPQLRQVELEHGSLIRGMLAARRRSPASKSQARRWPAFVTPTTGLAEIVEALQAQLSGADIRLGVQVERVESGEAGYRVVCRGGLEFSAAAVVLATPAFVTADIIHGLDPALSQILQAIPYVSTATVTVAYPLRDIARPLDGYGYIIPRAEARPILACTWTSTKFPHRAPDDFGLIRAFVGRAGQEDAVGSTDEDLLALVREELGRTLGITAPPILQRVFRWPRAMPQYTLGHPARLEAIEDRLAAHPGLYVAGNAYRGIGLPDCIASGERAAERLLVTLSLGG
jgi:oxygen-dependent protoporphyrinogen oxidase